MKDFDQEKHAVCPKCKFELIHYNAEEHTISYMNKNRTVDEETSTIEEVRKDEHNRIECNSRHCDYVEHEGDEE